ncbi:hypothetical protein RND81_09G091600 [Saponaria officinalis]|uniref:O-methyltransferase C-terminal domain-containing protein n=1 Tax=Saponaria officinalis TaxID=3572 RepID=A0AAW1IK09_SAPOF
MKFILHDWGDEECIKILKNCQKAVFEKKGKVIIMDIVLCPEGDDVQDDERFAMDIQMMVLFGRGKERTENDWKKLFNEAGFARYNIIKILALVSIIEVFSQ